MDSINGRSMRRTRWSQPYDPGNAPPRIVYLYTYGSMACCNRRSTRVDMLSIIVSLPWRLDTSRHSHGELQEHQHHRRGVQLTGARDSSSWIPGGQISAETSETREAGGSASPASPLHLLLSSLFLSRHPQTASRVHLQACSARDGDEPFVTGCTETPGDIFRR